MSQKDEAKYGTCNYGMWKSLIFEIQLHSLYVVDIQVEDSINVLLTSEVAMAILSHPQLPFE